VSQPAERPSGRWRRFRFRASYLLIPVALLVLAGAILQLIPANVYIFLPGQALAVAPMISVLDHRVPPKKGQLLLTDVSLYRANHLLEQLFAQLQPGADTQPASSVAGGLSESQYNQFNLQLMTDSTQAAEVAALYRVPGLHPHQAPPGPQIASILPGTPAASVLRPGDIVVAVNGHRVRKPADVGPEVRRVLPGALLSILIQRQGRTTTVHVRTIASKHGLPAKNGKTALIGITLSPRYILPVKVRINPGDIGGPSAGLMFALGLIQRLEPQDITHGCIIAGTGEIDYAGNVMPIGGAKQKVIAASRAGARYFLVPNVKDNVQPAEANRGSVRVVPVNTLDQALSFLKRIKPCR